jgi:DNA-binding protein H-NS
MASYKELIEQRQALEAQIEAARKAEIGEAVATIRQLCGDYGLTEKDIFTGDGKSSRKGSVVAAKYRDPATGATWTGRGKAPLWIAGADREKFLIA